MDLTRLRTLPSPDEIRQLPLFENIARQNIVLIQNLEQCRAIEAELKTAAVLGFDSESKPTFNVGEVSTGPHLIQLATLEKRIYFSSMMKFGNFYSQFLPIGIKLKSVLD